MFQWVNMTLLVYAQQEILIKILYQKDYLWITLEFIQNKNFTLQMSFYLKMTQIRRKKNVKKKRKKLIKIWIKII